MNLAIINLKDYEDNLESKFKTIVDDMLFIVNEENLKKLIEKYKLRKDDIIVVYKGLNSFVTEKLIKETIKEAKKNGVAVAGVRVSDTLKEVDEDIFVKKTLDRKKYWDIRYPRAIKYDLFKKIDGNIYNTNSLEKLNAKVVEIDSRWSNERR